MSQVYVKERPEPIPLSEHQRRRRVKDTQELLQVARKKGMGDAVVTDRLQQLDAILPDGFNLGLMKASDWLTVLKDVNSVAEKIVVLKSFYPRADVSRIIALRPKILLLRTVAIQEDAEKVRAMLKPAPEPDLIIQAVPDLADPATLTRCLIQITTLYPGQCPVMVLQQNPEVLRNMGGESDVKIHEEYGELSTKD